MKREFELNSILELFEADGFDGHLKIDSSTFFIKSVRLDAETKEVLLDVKFTASQGRVNVEHQRTIKYDYDSLPKGARDEIKSHYDWYVNAILKQIDKLKNAVEK